MCALEAVQLRLAYLRLIFVCQAAQGLGRQLLQPRGQFGDDRRHVCQARFDLQPVGSAQSLSIVCGAINAAKGKRQLAWPSCAAHGGTQGSAGLHGQVVQRRRNAGPHSLTQQAAAREMQARMAEPNGLLLRENAGLHGRAQWAAAQWETQAAWPNPMGRCLGENAGPHGRTQWAAAQGNAGPHGQT